MDWNEHGRDRCGLFCQVDFYHLPGGTGENFETDAITDVPPEV
jgi:hypothetical protein